MVAIWQFRQHHPASQCESPREQSWSIVHSHCCHALRHHLRDQVHHTHLACHLIAVLQRPPLRCVHRSAWCICAKWRRPRCLPPFLWRRICHTAPGWHRSPATGGNRAFLQLSSVPAHGANCTAPGWCYSPTEDVAGVKARLHCPRCQPCRRFAFP